MFDHDQDSDMTSDWFEEEEETNLKPAETEQSDEEDYMTMDVSSFDKKSWETPLLAQRTRDSDNIVHPMCGYKPIGYC